MERRNASLRLITRFSIPRRVASPKDSKAFPVRVPGPHIVLPLLAVLLAADEAYEIVDKVLSCRESLFIRVSEVDDGDSQSQ